MIQRLLLLSAVFFWLSSSSSSQELNPDQSISGNVLNPSDIEGQWNSCTPGVNCWSGETGGALPNWSGDTAYWGYGGGILKWTSAINTALEAAGMQINGYLYQWRVKNGDTNADQNDGDDYMRISVRIYDKAGNEVWGKQYNLDGYYNWSYFNGVEFFDESLKADDLSTVIIRAEGDDPGFWAGYYGPEFNVADSYVRFIYSEIPDPCNDVPVVDPNCENFIGAAPQEDPAVKELVIIESTGSIPLSEDELAVLESLEEEQEEETIETAELEQQEEEKPDNSAALAVAQNAEANAISEAEKTIDNTLTATAIVSQELVQQSFSINQSSTEQSNQSMQQAESSQQQSSQSSMDQGSMDMGEGVSADGNVNINTLLSQTQSQQQEIQLSIELTTDTFEIAALDNAIENAVLDLIARENQIVREQVEDSKQEEVLSEPMSNEQEDELVAAALEGDNSEEAQAALLGFNPNFRAYQQPQMTDADFYKPKDIYEGQKNYDNPNARFFNGASDATHREMIRQQYEGN